MDMDGFGQILFRSLTARYCNIRMTVFMPGQSRQSLVTMVQYGLSAVVIVTATVILMLQYRSVMLRKKI